MKQIDVQSTFGNIDIYLFDQLLKGRFDHCSDVLDIGCGRGRNLVYFLKNNFQVFGIDQDEDCISSVRLLAHQLAPHLPSSNFSVGLAEAIPFQISFDLVISSAVFHFARNRAHFESMLYAAWKVVKTGGFLFTRLASDIGIKHLIKHKGDGRYYLPDGSERYLVSENDLHLYTEKLNAHLFEPIKTTNVQNLRCMSTWCMSKK